MVNNPSATIKRKPFRFYCVLFSLTLLTLGPSFSKHDNQIFNLVTVRLFVCVNNDGIPRLLCRNSLRFFLISFSFFPFFVNFLFCHYLYISFLDRHYYSIIILAIQISSQNKKALWYFQCTYTFIPISKRWKFGIPFFRSDCEMRGT